MMTAAADDLFDVTGRVVVITGASSGLGAHFAAFLAERGATVVAAARRMDRLNELAGQCPGIIPVRADVTALDDRERLVEEALRLGGRLDVLINNAGAGSSTPALDESIDTFDRVMTLNLSASFALCTLVAGHMVGRGAGSIVNIASILGLVASAPVPQAAYGAAKGGLVSLTRHLAAEWAERNIRVNAIAPGWFASELTDEMFANESSLRWIERNTPMRRPRRIDEFDGTLLLLASDAGRFITGQTIVVDGGWTARLAEAMLGGRVYTLRFLSLTRLVLRPERRNRVDYWSG